MTDDCHHPPCAFCGKPLDHPRALCAHCGYDNHDERHQDLSQCPSKPQTEK